MANPCFYKKLGPYRLSEIIKLIDVRVSEKTTYSSDLLIHDIKSLEEASSTDISFLSNNKYISEFYDTKACACIVPDNFTQKSNNGIIILESKNPYYAYAKLVKLFYTRAKTYPNKIMPSSYIADSVTIGKNCYIGHNAVIEENVVIGDDCVIESGTIIDFGSIIGNRALIYQNVLISYSIIGDDVLILPGASIGQDGFGFATDKGVHQKIFHTGLVRIGNNVEIGSNTTIDRGSINDTIIEDFCRIDNLVQIGHNAIIGRGTIIVAQAGISGSCKVGAYCALGGQSGLAGHIVVGDEVQIAAKAGVIKDTDSGVIIGGYPAVPIRDWHKQSIIMKQLVNKSCFNGKN